MGLADALPVVAADAEHRGAAGGAAAAVDARDLARLEAEIVAEGWRSRLRGTQVRLLHDREPREIRQRAQGRRRHAGGLPAAAIEGAALPRVLHLGAKLGEHDLVARFRIGALELGRPVLGVRRRPPHRIVARGPGRRGRRGHVRGRAATASRTRRTTSSGGVSCSTTSDTPHALSAGTSSSGMTPPTTSTVSSA